VGFVETGDEDVNAYANVVSVEDFVRWNPDVKSDCSLSRLDYFIALLIEIRDLHCAGYASRLVRLQFNNRYIFQENRDGKHEPCHERNEVVIAK
jgi:hypothetical protein